VDDYFIMDEQQSPEQRQLTTVGKEPDDYHPPRSMQMAV
jgi:hypothetical protein